MPGVDRRSIPNLVTFVRVLLIVPFWICFALPGLGPATAAVAIALAIEVTDLLDGWLARRLGATSDLGKLLDPAADAFSRLAIFIAFASHPTPDGGLPWLPGWIAVVMLFRDVGVSLVRQVAAARGTVVGARTSGKIKAWVQGVAIWLILVFHLEGTWKGAVEPGRRSIAFAAGCVAAAFMLFTLVDYVAGNRAAFSGMTRSIETTNGNDAAGGPAA
jgi:CDP-diacylglycerol--glycerol-3-phosphate 3-phosphatidyltransferase